jgi:tetratricopeptide (TPR) repeat protein
MRIGLLIEEQDMNRFNQDNGNMEIKIGADNVKHPRKTAPRRVWIAGMFVALIIAALAACGSIDHRSCHAREARFNKDATLKGQDKREEELAIHEALDQDSSSCERAQLACALFNKGVALGEQGKIEEELAVYEEIARRFGQDASPGVRELVVKTLFNKSVTLRQQGKREEEIAVYEEIDRRFGQDTSPGVREQVAKALASKGVTLGEQGKREEEFAIYEDINRRFGQDASSVVREWVVMALVNKAVTLFEFHNDAAGALAVLDSVLAHCDDSPESAVQAQCFRVLKNSVEPLLVLEKPRDAA